MKYLSVCSGMEAATVAWAPLGWQAIAFSEIEKFPNALLAHYYPSVPNLGDMRRFKEWPDAAPDVLVGGTPCQAFSVAGLRAGLADPRGNLTLTYLAIAARFRPRWLVWENVPGVLSDKTGAFGSLLGGLAELGYGWAYRTLDAQFFRVAQQRRRVFVVGSLGGWRRAGAVLFERESLSGNPAPRREARQGAPTGVAGSLGSRGNRSHTELDGHGAYVAHALRGEGFDASEDGTGRGIPLVVGALTDGAHNGGGLNGQDAYTGRIIAFTCKDHGADAGDTSPTLRAMGHDSSHANAGGQVAVAFVQNQRNEVRTLEVAGALAGEPGMKQQTYLSQRLRVRRLTPRECERLQGFPDDYSLIPYRGAPAKDGPRYKAIGNSMAVPVMRWIGDRIALVDELVPMELAA